MHPLHPPPAALPRQPSRGGAISMKPSAARLLRGVGRRGVGTLFGGRARFGAKFGAIKMICGYHPVRYGSPGSRYGEYTVGASCVALLYSSVGTASQCSLEG